MQPDLDLSAQNSLQDCLCHPGSIPVSDAVRWDDGWPKVKAGIDNAIRKIEDDTPVKMSAAEVMGMYHAVYQMTMQSWPHQYCKDLYEAYRKSFEDYLTDVLERIESQDNPTELISRIWKAWENNKSLVKHLSRIFEPLSRVYIPMNKVPALEKVARMSFYECILDQPYKGTTESVKRPDGDSIHSIHERAKQAFLEVKHLTQDAAVDDKENNGTKTLVKNVQEILEQAEIEQRKYVEKAHKNDLGLQQLNLQQAN